MEKGEFLKDFMFDNQETSEIGIGKIGKAKPQCQQTDPNKRGVGGKYMSIIIS